MANIEQQITLSNLQFLQAIFRDHAPFAHCCSFIEAPDTLETPWLWKGDIYHVNPVENPQNNNFATISVFNPDSNGEYRRRKVSHLATFAIMIDDIGTGPGSKIMAADFEAAGAPPPSWSLETSPNNYQWGYILRVPEQSKGRVEAILTGLVALDLAEGGKDPGMMGVTRYFRMPVGSNTKSTYGTPFPHRLDVWQPENQYTIDSLAEAFGLRVSHYIPDDKATADALPSDSDPVLASLKRLKLYKYTKAQGHYDITCPWVEGHTKQQDNGAMRFPGGFKCHHGSCDGRNGQTLLNYLVGADPEYAAACEINPFSAIESAVPVDNVIPITSAPPRVTPGMAELISRIDKLDTKTPIEVVEAICQDIAAASLTATAEDDLFALMVASPRKLTKLGLRKSVKDARKQNVQANLDRGLVGNPYWTSSWDNGSPKPTESNFQNMIDFLGIKIRYNQMTHETETTIPNVIHNEEDRGNLDLTYMKDQLINYDISTIGCDQMMTYIGHKNAYHPFIRYLESADVSKYDPSCPAFNKLVATIGFDCDREQATMFIRKWLISVVAAARGSMGFGMKGVLVFAGPQNIGKTSWLRYLVPKEMFGEGLHLDPNSKDSITLATRYLVSELGELDGTLKKDIAALKSFISNLKDEVRAPYEVNSRKTTRRKVFAGTVNQIDFLRDGTGNSRFWPVGVKSFDLATVQAMQESGEMKLLWQEVDQMYAAFAAGEAFFDWRIAAGSKENVILEELSRDYQELTPIRLALQERFDFNMPLTNLLLASEIMTMIGLSMSGQFNYGTGRQLREAIEFLTGQRGKVRRYRDKVQGEYYLMPTSKADRTHFKPVMDLVESDPADFDFI